MGCGSSVKEGVPREKQKKRNNEEKGKKGGKEEKKLNSFSH